MKSKNFQSLVKSCNYCFKYISPIPRFCVEGLLKILNFGDFILIWWQTDKKQEILKQSELQGPVFWTEMPIV